MHNAYIVTMFFPLTKDFDSNTPILFLGIVYIELQKQLVVKDPFDPSYSYIVLPFNHFQD